VEGAIVHDQQLAEKMEKSEDLLICIDERSKSAGQSFMEIEFRGRDGRNNSKWCKKMATEISNQRE